jgi:hypothetical protein
MIRAFIVILLLLPTIASADDHSLPDRLLTPGAVLEIVPASAAKCLSDLMAAPVNPGEFPFDEIACAKNGDQLMRIHRFDWRRAVACRWLLSVGHPHYRLGAFGSRPAGISRSST